jgi:hypothetical protein
LTCYNLLASLDPVALETCLSALRRAHASQSQPPSEDRLDTLGEAVAKSVASVLMPWAQYVTVPTQTNKRLLADRLKEMQFSRKQGVQQLTAEDAGLVLQHRPIWAVSTLSAGSRVPLKPALFDYVIFDEASQCGIASAIPSVRSCAQGCSRR